MRAHASRFCSAVPFAAMLFCALPGAKAGDAAYCVTCKGPDQTYLCRIAGGDGMPIAEPPFSDGTASIAHPRPRIPSVQ